MLALVASLFTLLVAPRFAQAQIPDAVYSDAKDIIAELLSAEVSEAAVPGIACYSGRQKSSASDVTAIQIDKQEKGAPPVAHYVLEAPRHFPRSLQRIYNRQYGTLRTTIREEAASLSAYLVFRGLIAANLSARHDAANFNKVARQLGKAVDRAAGSVGADEINFSPLAPEQLTLCTKNIRSRFESHTFNHQALYPVDIECAASRTTRKAAFDGYECNVAFAVRARLLDDRAAAQDYLVKALAAILLENAGLLENDAAYDSLVELLREQLLRASWDGVSFAAALVKLGSLTADLQKIAQLELDTVLSAWPAATRGAVDAVLAALPPMATSEERIRAVALAPGAPADINRALKTARMASLSLAPLLAQLIRVPRLYAVWHSAISNGGGMLDVEQFLAAVADTSAGLCSPGTGASCAALAALTNEATGVAKLVGPFVQLASRGEYRELAHLTVRYLFQRTTGEEDEESTNVYQRFAESVVIYVLDVADDKVPSDGTRAAFRAAAIDLLRELGRAGGVSRRAWTVKSVWIFRAPTFVPFVLPDLGMRLSWSPSYVNQSDGASRVVATVNWLNLRMPIKRGGVGYFGLELSAIDPLAPLSELALRRTSGTRYRDVSKLATNIISPRLEAIAAIPSISEHLVLSAGMGLRLVAPLKNTKLSSPDEEVYDYRSVFHSADEDGTSQVPRFLEFGLALKYVL